jgi:CxxC motif-containing protein
MKEIVCIICPNSCRLQIETEPELKVSGAKCKRGVEFAEQEILNPRRSLTTTVRTIFPDYPVLSVRSSGDIKKELIFPVMREIRGFVLRKPVRIGEVVIPDILQTGVDIIATSEITMAKEKENETI